MVHWFHFTIELDYIGLELEQGGIGTTKLYWNPLGFIVIWDDDDGVNSGSAMNSCNQQLADIQPVNAYQFLLPE